MVPKGWEVKKLNDLCEINPKKPSKPTDELVSFISMSQVSEDGQVIYAETKTYDEVSKGFTSFRDKDVLVAKITPCFENGKGALTSNLVNGIGFGSTEFHVLRAKKSTDPKFIYYLTRTNAFRSKGTMNMQGSAGHRRVTTDFIKAYKINTPPLPEQQKIANILSTWDKAISTTERLIAKSTQQKKALMQQLLTGKKRLLDDNGERFSVDWESLTIGDVVELFNGYAFKSSDALEKGYKWLKIANVGIGEIKWDNSSYLPEGYKDEYSRFNLKVGDIVVAMTRPTLGNQLKIAKLKNKADESLLNQRVAKLLFSKKVSSEYIYQLLSTTEVAHKLNHALLGTDPPNLSTKVLHEISMELPPLIEQQKIAAVLTNADNEIERLEQQLAHLQQEKKALMQVLLTGKKRVVVDG